MGKPTRRKSGATLTSSKPVVTSHSDNEESNVPDITTPPPSESCQSNSNGSNTDELISIKRSELRSIMLDIFNEFFDSKIADLLHAKFDSYKDKIVNDVSANYQILETHIAGLETAASNISADRASNTEINDSVSKLQNELKITKIALNDLEQHSRR